MLLTFNLDVNKNLVKYGLAFGPFKVQSSLFPVKFQSDTHFRYLSLYFYYYYYFKVQISRVYSLHSLKFN